MIGGSADYTGYLSAGGIESPEDHPGCCGRRWALGQHFVRQFLRPAVSIESAAPSLEALVNLADGWTSPVLGWLRLAMTSLGDPWLATLGLRASRSAVRSTRRRRIGRKTRLFIIGEGRREGFVGGDLIRPQHLGDGIQAFLQLYPDKRPCRQHCDRRLHHLRRGRQHRQLTNCASIRVGEDLGALTIKGSIIGHADIGDGAAPVIITARGQSRPGRDDGRSPSAGLPSAAAWSTRRSWPALIPRRLVPQMARPSNRRRSDRRREGGGRLGLELSSRQG